MGCNAIRTAHNPPAPEFLNLCDKMGFLVVNEAFDVWRKKKSEYDYALFFDAWHKKDLEDFIVRDRNHPSVIVWSIGNEVKEQWGDDYSDVLLTRRLAEIVKELDPTRPVTAGCDEPGEHNNLFSANVLISLDIITVAGHMTRCRNVSRQTLFGYGDHFFFAYQRILSNALRFGQDRAQEWWMSYVTPHYACSSYDNMHVPWGSTHEDT